MQFPALSPQPTRARNLALSVEDDRQPQSPLNLPSGQPDIARIAIPLRVEAMVIGVMGVDYPEPRHIDEAEQRILGLLVAQAAITLQNAQLHEQVKRYAFNLEQRVVERTAELERQRQRLQTILDSAGEGIQIMDADGRIEYINPAAEQPTDFTAQEVVGQVSRLWDFISGESPGLDQARQQL